MKKFLMAILAVLVLLPASAQAHGSLDYKLQSIRACESGGNYRTNTGNGFYGAYQFVPSTWRSVAPGKWKYVLPHRAPKWAQDAAARKLFLTAGPGQWPVCSRR